MNKRQLVALFVAAASGLILATILTFVGRGNFVHAIVVGGLCLYVALPSAALGLLAFLVGRRWRPRLMRWFATVCFFVVVVIALQPQSLVCGNALASRDVRRAREFCEALVPSLEAHKRATGSYPEEIEALLPADAPLPRLLEASDFYGSDGGAFGFRLYDPRGLLGTVHEFSSEAREWDEYD